MRVVISAGGTGGHIYPALAIINKISGEGHYREVSRVTIQDINRYVKEECYFPRMFMKIEDDCVRVLQNLYRKWSTNNKSILEGNEKIPLLTFVMHYAQSSLFGDYLKKKNDKSLEYFDLLTSICLFNKKYSLDQNVKKTYGEKKVDKTTALGTKTVDESEMDDKAKKVLLGSSHSSEALKIEISSPKYPSTSTPLKEDDSSKIQVKKAPITIQEAKSKKESRKEMFKNEPVGRFSLSIRDKSADRRKRSDTFAAFFRQAVSRDSSACSSPQFEDSSENQSSEKTLTPKGSIFVRQNSTPMASPGSHPASLSSVSNRSSIFGKTFSSKSQRRESFANVPINEVQNEMEL